MQTLEELIQEIDLKIQKKNIDNALDLLSPFDKYAGDDWQIHFESELNEFQYSVLYKDANFRLVLIYWNESSKSKKHGHLKGGGLMRVLYGQINETRFHPDNSELAIGDFEYSKGDLSYIHDALGLHIVENKADIPAVSLHLYCDGVNSTFGNFDDTL
ncbi:MAG: cysteine dioxygenase family protein [Saprospiraceae bacterium]